MVKAMATVTVAVAGAVAAMVTAMVAATTAQESTKRRWQWRRWWLQMRNRWRVAGGSSLHKSVEEIDHQLSSMFFIKNTKGIMLGCRRVHLRRLLLKEN